MKFLTIQQLENKHEKAIDLFRKEIAKKYSNSRRLKILDRIIGEYFFFLNRKIYN